MNKYLETIDLTISTEQALTDIEIIRLVLDKERNKVELDNSESGNESLAITIQEGFNGLKTWIQYLKSKMTKNLIWRKCVFLENIWILCDRSL